MKNAIIGLVLLFSVSRPCFTAPVVEVSVNGQIVQLRKKGLLYHNNTRHKVWRAVLDRNTTLILGGKKYVFRGGGQVVFYRSGALYSGQLVRDTWYTFGGNRALLQGNSGKDRYTAFYASGQLQQADLAKDSWINTGRYRLLFRRTDKENEEIFFHESGRIKKGSLARPVRIRIWRNSVLFASSMISFYPSGQVNWGRLAADQYLTIAGSRAKFAASPYHTIAFHKSGIPAEGRLVGSQWVRTGGRDIKLRYNIRTDLRGNIARCTLAAPFVFKGTTFSEDSTITIYCNRYGRMTVVRRYRFPRR